jgi:hypothetical protein
MQIINYSGYIFPTYILSIRSYSNQAVNVITTVMGDATAHS